MAKVYVAGSTGEIDRVNLVQHLVSEAGNEITFDWTGAEGTIITDGSWDSHSVIGSKVSSREIKACQDADLTIVVSPKNKPGLGCWIEMGATLASGGQVWVIDPQRDSVFWQHPNVTRFDTINDVESALYHAAELETCH